MLDIKRTIAALCCFAVCASSFAACGKKDDDKNKGDGFSINEVSADSVESANDNHNDDKVDQPESPNVNNEVVQEDVPIAQEFDYFGLVYTLNEVVQYEFDQIDGVVLVVDLTITNNSEYEYVVGALANFNVAVDDIEGKTTDYVTAQAMTLTSRMFHEQGLEYDVFGTSNTPPIKPGDTLSGYIPIALTGDAVNFENIRFSFCPDGTTNAQNKLTATITPADVKAE